MAKKRARQSHSGSVYFSGGIWYAAVMVLGKRRRVKCTSRAIADRKLSELREMAAAGSTLTHTTCKAFKLRWLDHLKKNKASKTIESYEYALGMFEELDSVPLDQITGAAIQRVVDGLSGRAAQVGFDKFRQMLRMAVKWKCLQSHPMEHLERPKHSRKQIDLFSLEEVQQVIEHTKDSRYGAAIQLAFSVGLRGGECWGLQWGDLGGDTLTIKRQACESAGTLEIKEPKTSAGIRRILLPDSVVDALADRRKSAMAEGQAGSPWIFPGEKGSPTRRSNFGHRVWQPALKALKIRHRGFHHARHTAATLLLNSGAVPLSVVSKILGHASPAITLTTYAHVMTTDQERHRNAFDLILKRG